MERQSALTVRRFSLTARKVVRGFGARGGSVPARIQASTHADGLSRLIDGLSLFRNKLETPKIGHNRLPGRQLR